MFITPEFFREGGGWGWMEWIYTSELCCSVDALIDVVDATDCAMLAFIGDELEAWS